LSVSGERSRRASSAKVKCMSEGELIDWARKNIIKEGVLYDYQVRALRLIARSRRNILVVAPTGMGKTLVGYSALAFYGKGTYIAPTRALCDEKYFELQSLFPKKRVVIGNKDFYLSPWRFKKSDMRVVTPWRLDIYLSHLKRAFGYYSPVVVIDEIHSLDSYLEIIFTKLKMLDRARIIGLSATIHEEDLEKFSKWLNAVVVRSLERRIPLVKRIVFFDEDIDDEGEIVTKMNVMENGKVVGRLEFEGEVDKCVAITEYIRKVERDDHPILFFSLSRSRANEIAVKMAKLFPEAVDEEVMDRVGLLPDKGIGRTLGFCLLNGVGIHHGGLPAEYRRLVFDLAKKNKLKYISTCLTLAQGVNLPARHVVFDDIHTVDEETGEKRVISATLFNQVAGRAGRPDYDEIGFVWVPAESEVELKEIEEYLFKFTADKITSKIFNRTFMETQVPVLIMMGYRTREDIIGFLKKTYLGVTSEDHTPLVNMVNDIIATLEKEKVVEKKEDGSLWLTETGYKIARCGLHYLEYKAIMQLVNTNAGYDKWVDALTNLEFELQMSGNSRAVNLKKDIIKLVKTYGLLVYAIRFGFANFFARQLADHVLRVMAQSIMLLNEIDREKARAVRSEIYERFIFFGLPQGAELKRVLTKKEAVRAIRLMGETLQRKNLKELTEREKLDLVFIVFGYYKRINKERLTKLCLLLDLNPEKALNYIKEKKKEKTRKKKGEKKKKGAGGEK